MFDVAQKYRIDPYESFFEADHGASLNATVIPMYKKSTTGETIGLNGVPFIPLNYMGLLHTSSAHEYFWVKKIY